MYLGTCTTLRRYDHVSWASEAGVVLMGGGSSRNTTEIVRQDGSVETGFDLVLDTWCVENFCLLVLVVSE